MSVNAPGQAVAWILWFWGLLGHGPDFEQIGIFQTHPKSTRLG